jgi:hypothetical protein
MGGRIWAAPRSEGGSEFSFALPLYWTEDEGRGDEDAPQVSSGEREVREAISPM